MERSIAQVTQRKHFGRLLVADQSLRSAPARLRLLLEGRWRALRHALALEELVGRPLARLIGRATLPKASIAIIEGTSNRTGRHGLHLRCIGICAAPLPPLRVARCALLKVRETLAACIDKANEAELWIT